jgi:hypothetical protein
VGLLLEPPSADAFPQFVSTMHAYIAIKVMIKLKTATLLPSPLLRLLKPDPAPSGEVTGEVVLPPVNTISRLGPLLIVLRSPASSLVIALEEKKAVAHKETATRASPSTIARVLESLV